MLPRSLKQTESVVFEALEAAAKDYTNDRGRFLPFAKNRIHDALESYENALRHVSKNKWQMSGKRKNEGYLDIAAFKRGMLANGARINIPQ
jgi:hypothetical protein